jgi:HAD superfamily hydrolase (TIGR01549 family)
VTYKLILFDLDDTLCDYAAARAQRLRIAFGNAFTEVGIEPGDLDAMIAESILIHPHGADHFSDLLARYGVNNKIAAINSRRWYQSNRFHGLKLFPDALDLLKLVRSSSDGRTVGLITNGPAEVQRAKIALLGLEPHVDFVLISGEFGFAKPDPDIFREALRLGRALHFEAVVIGDSPEFDIAGARQSRIASVWVNRTGCRWKHPSPPPNFEVDSLSALIPLLGLDASRHAG